MDTPERAAQRIFGERAAHYATSDAHTDAEALRRVLERAQPRPEWIALDIATGTGHTAFALAPHVARVVATDLTGAMLHEGMTLRTRTGITNVEFGVADAHFLPFQTASFNLVSSRLAPHHFSDIHGALEEMARVLNRGGRLVISDRSVPDDDFVDSAMNRLDTWHDASHVRQYRVGEWRAMLEAHGFRVETSEQFVKSRPLSSLTRDVAPADLEKIQRFLDELDPERQARLGYVDVDGEHRINHWYVLVAAVKS